MTQLREEGWIHHLARHAVACFLTRGDLWISWEEGMKVFEELLLDADWSVNAGMWMWLSCSSFFQQFFHCYCPVRFGRKADPNGDYIRKYLPVLKNYPIKYIHEPWIAPEAVQKTAKCIIGKDYPVPMVNHSVASRMNMERMKQVYQQLSKYRPTVAVHIALSLDEELAKSSKLIQMATTATASQMMNSPGGMMMVDTENLLCPLATNSGDERRRTWDSNGFQMPATRAAVDKLQVENTLNYDKMYIESASPGPVIPTKYDGNAFGRVLNATPMADEQGIFFNKNSKMGGGNTENNIYGTTAEAGGALIQKITEDGVK